MVDRVGREGAVGCGGRGNLRAAKTPPLQSAMRGYQCATQFRIAKRCPNRDAARRHRMRKPSRPVCPLPYLRTCAVPAPYMRNTRVAAPSDFTAKSEGAATMVRRWYGDGGGMVRGWQGDGREAGGVARQGHGGGRGTGGGIFALRSKTATRHATSLQRPWGLHLRGARYAHGEVVGGGIFALRGPRPYSRRWRGGRCDACGIDHHLRPRRH